MKTLTFLFIFLLACVSVFAQDTVAPAITQAVAPSWVEGILAFLIGIPKVGPVIVTVVSVIGAVGAFFTAMSTFVQAVLAIPQVAAKWVGAHDFAEKVKKFSDTVMPWIKYLSLYNVQKK